MRLAKHMPLTADNTSNSKYLNTEFWIISVVGLLGENRNSLTKSHVESEVLCMHDAHVYNMLNFTHRADSA